MKSHRSIVGILMSLLAAVIALPAAASPAAAAGTDFSRLVDALSGIVKVVEQKNIVLFF